MKFYGKVGYQIETETTDSVWESTIVEKPYYGDVIRNASRRESSDTINDELISARHILE